MLLPLAVEPLVAYIFARPRVPPLTMLRAFRGAVVDWFTYNRHGASGPGTFQGFVGPYAFRRQMSLSLIVLFATGVTQFISPARYVYVDVPSDANYHQRTTGEFLDDFGQLLHRLFGHEEPKPATPKQEQPPIPWSSRSMSPAEDQLSPQQSLGGKRSSAALIAAGMPRNPPDFDVGPSNSLDSNEQSSPGLQPWQKAMLERMSAEDRTSYLKKLKETAAATPSADQTDTNGERKRHVAHELEDYGAFDFLMWIVRFLTFIAMCIFPTLAMLIPPLLFLSCCFATSGRVVGFYASQFGNEQATADLDHSRWEDVVKRIRSSKDEREKDSLFLGLNAHDGTPVIVPRAIFKEHAHILGDSGSGKTSMGLATLISQLIRFRDSSIVVLDLKADDLALFEDCRIEAVAAQLPFRWFTSELNVPTYIFNPLTQRHFAPLSLYQRTDILTAALGIQYGTDYGRGFFADANADVLAGALKARPNAQSFREIEQAFGWRLPSVSPETRKAGSHVGTLIRRFADCVPLNATSKTASAEAIDHAIDLAEPFEQPQVLYFHLPSALGTTTSSEIARMVLYMLLTSAKAQGPDRKQVYVVIDEFQRITAKNVEFVLQTARSMNIGLILANQALMDLRTPDVNLIPTVSANTRLKRVFAASDRSGQQDLVESSGETIIYSRSWSDYIGSGFGVANVASVSNMETVSPRLRPNDILLASDHPFQSIVHIRRGDGYAQFGGLPFVMTSSYHISEKEYAARKLAKWPERPGETIPSASQPADMPSKPEHVSTPPIGPDPVIGISQPDSGETGTNHEPKPAILTEFDSHWLEQQQNTKRLLPAGGLDTQSPDNKSETKGQHTHEHANPERGS